MGKEYVVQGAICMCQFGAAPGMLKVTDNQGVYMNGKLAATNMTLGNVFQPPGFGICKMNPMIPKPCMPAVTMWTDFYDGMSINGSSLPLTDTSKATCGAGTPHCISLQTTGQILIPGIPQMKKAAVEHHSELNPVGVSEALSEEIRVNKELDKTPILMQVMWKDEQGKEIIDEIPEEGKLTVCAIVENAGIGEIVQFTITLEDGRKIDLSGTTDAEGAVEIKDIDMKSIIQQE